VGRSETISTRPRDPSPQMASKSRRQFIDNIHTDTKLAENDLYQ